MFYSIVVYKKMFYSIVVNYFFLGTTGEVNYSIVVHQYFYANTRREFKSQHVFLFLFSSIGYPNGMHIFQIHSYISINSFGLVVLNLIFYSMREFNLQVGIFIFFHFLSQPPKRPCHQVTLLDRIIYLQHHATYNSTQVNLSFIFWMSI